MSDLHLELDRKLSPIDTFRFTSPELSVSASQGPSLDLLLGAVDLVLLAGDVDAKTKGVGYANVLAGYLGVPVVYVAGNHEFYGSHIELIGELERAAQESEAVHFLENRRAEFEFGGKHVVVLGATLWTDYEILGPDKRQEAMENGEEYMTDYQLIRANPPSRRLQPADTMTRHHESRAWLESELAALAPDVVSIVLTHHAPSARSLAPAMQGEMIAAAYASNLDDRIAELKPTLWVHGHTHWMTSYRIGSTRIVSHPFGYPQERVSHSPLLLRL